MRSPTLKQLQTAARKRWKSAIVVHNKKAPDRETRELWAQQNRDAHARKKDIEQLLEQKAMTNLLRRLTDAAKFVCDVDGGAPSIDELKDVVTDAERCFSLKAEWSSLNEATKQRPTYYKRWSVIECSAPFGLAMQTRVIEADSAEELMKAIG